MKLVFDKEIEFLKKELGIGIPSKTAFMDRMGIKVLDKNNKWETLHRIRAKEMNLELVKSNDVNLDNIKTWEDIIEDNKERLNEIELKSISIIKEYIGKFKGYTIAIPISGGKDSAITHYLVTKAVNELNEESNDKINIVTIFSNTSNETHHTYKYVKKNYPDVLIINPKEGFYNLVKRTGTVPSRFNRFCCTVMKEMPMIQQLDKETKYLFFMGMRSAESAKRSEYGVEWKNHRWTSELWQGILPIIDWTDMDVLLFELSRNIEINDIYTFGFARCGCTNCPYRSDYELMLNKEFLPTYYDRWQQVLKDDFIINKKAPSINCSLDEYTKGAWKGGVVHEEPSEEAIQEFAEQQGLDIDIARKYFNKNCSCCNKKLKKNDIGLSMKYYGRQIEKFRCLSCISEELNIPKKELKEKIKEFKSDNCVLF